MPDKLELFAGLPQLFVGTDEPAMFDSNAMPTGQVENYLQDVLNCQRKTLGNTLKRSLKRYPNQARVEWLMDADPPGSISKTDPAQVEHGLATHPFRVACCVAIGNAGWLNDLSTELQRIDACPTPYFVLRQIALLVAGINYGLEVEATLDRVVTGDNSALTGYHDLQVSAC